MCYTICKVPNNSLKWCLNNIKLIGGTVFCAIIIASEFSVKASSNGGFSFTSRKVTNNMNEVKPTDYISIQGWMLDYELTSTECIAFAVIHGFTRDGKHWYHGSAQYLANWCGISRQRAYDILKSLVDKNLVEKREAYKNGVKFCEYRAIVSNGVSSRFDTPSNNLTPPCQKTGHNNIKDIIENNKKESRPDPEISSPTSTPSSPTIEPSSSTTNTPAIRMKPSALRQQLATIFRAKDMTKTRSNNAISKLQSQFDDDSIIIEAAKKMKARGEIKFSDGTTWTADYFWFVNPEKTDAVVKGIIRVMKNSLVDEEKDPRTEKIHEWMLSHGYTEQDLKDPNLLLRTLKDKEYQDFVWRLNNVK